MFSSWLTLRIFRPHNLRVVSDENVRPSVFSAAGQGTWFQLVFQFTAGAAFFSPEARKPFHPFALCFIKKVLIVLQLVTNLINYSGSMCFCWCLVLCCAYRFNGRLICRFFFNRRANDRRARFVISRWKFNFLSSETFPIAKPRFNSWKFNQSICSFVQNHFD